MQPASNRGGCVIRLSGRCTPESAIFALPLMGFSFLLSAESGGGAEARNFMIESVLGVGAGIYEELVFRLVLISVVSMIGADLLGPSRQDNNHYCGHCRSPRILWTPSIRRWAASLFQAKSSSFGRWLACTWERCSSSADTDPLQARMRCTTFWLSLQPDRAKRKPGLFILKNPDSRERACRHRLFGRMRISSATTINPF